MKITQALFVAGYSSFYFDDQKAIKAALLAFERSAEGQAFFEKTRNEGFRETTAADNALLDRALPETRRLLGPVLR